MLKRTGGVDGDRPGDRRTTIGRSAGSTSTTPRRTTTTRSGAKDGRYYVQYPKQGVHDIAIHKTLFDTASADGITAVSFYAQETGREHGRLPAQPELDPRRPRLRQPQRARRARRVLPRPERRGRLQAGVGLHRGEDSTRSCRSPTRRATRQGRLLDRPRPGLRPGHRRERERRGVLPGAGRSSTSAIRTTRTTASSGCSTRWAPTRASSSRTPGWSSCRYVGRARRSGVGDLIGGYQLVLDNWKLEAFNEDEVYVRYNDVQYMRGRQRLRRTGGRGHRRRRTRARASTASASRTTSRST